MSVVEHMPFSACLLGIASSLLHVVALARPDCSQWIVGGCISTSSALSLYFLGRSISSSHRQLCIGTTAIMLYVNLRILCLSSERRVELLTVLLISFVALLVRLVRERAWLFAIPAFLSTAFEDANTLNFLLSTQLGAIVAFVVHSLDIFEERYVTAWAAACLFGKFAKLASGRGEYGLAVAAMTTLYLRREREPVQYKILPPPPPPAPPPRHTPRALPAVSETEKSEQTPETKKVKKYFGYIRGKLGEVNVDENDEKQTPSQEEIDEVVTRVLEEIQQKKQRRREDSLEEEVEVDAVRTWSTRCLVVHKRRVDRAVEVCLNLIFFRQRWKWPLVIKDARPIEDALRSGMHTVLPGRDRLGRRVVTYSAAALSSYRRPIGELQQMMCFLLERLVEEEQTQQVGVTFLVDLSGASLKTLRSLGLEDVRRGMDMLTDSFPCRLRAVYVINLPRIFGPAASLITSLLPAKIRARLHVSRRGGAKKNTRLLEDVPLSMIPASMGGTLKDSYWKTQVDRYLEHSN